MRRIGLAEYNAASDEPPVPAMPFEEKHLGGMAAGAIFLGSADGIYDFITDFGPNHGLTIYTRVPLELDFGVMVHPEMENQGVFFRRHPASNGGGTCVQRGFPAYVQLILEHEGMPMSPQSHTGVYFREYVPRAGPAVEDLVFPNEALEAMNRMAEAKLDPVMLHADAVSDAEVDTHHKVRFACNFKWS